MEKLEIIYELLKHEKDKKIKQLIELLLEDKLNCVF